jgi:hypothetical protein
MTPIHQIGQKWQSLETGHFDGQFGDAIWHQSISCFQAGTAQRRPISVRMYTRVAHDEDGEPARRECTAMAEERENLQRMIAAAVPLSQK